MRRGWKIFIVMELVGLILAIIGAYIMMTGGVGITLIVIGALLMFIPICSLEFPKLFWK
ncbi:MAG: hypothetical protein ACW96X_08735 [Promethearchaeota archaeon]|jgi:hypothetical protein